LKTKSEHTFFDDVYALVRLIPDGRITSYGAIAAYLGSKGSSRMVGWVMNNAHQFGDVPAHRVVNRKGVLTGKLHFGEIDAMQRLLEAEGIKIIGDQVVEFEKLFWDPAKEIHL